MSRIIEAKAVISGEDRLSNVLDKVNAKFKQFGKGTKISADTDRLNKSLANTRKQLEAIEKMRAAQDRFGSAKFGLGVANNKADQIVTKLAAAQKANDKAATAALVAEQRQAQREVLSATRAVERQGDTLRAAKQELAHFGVPIRDLSAHEASLKTSIDKTTAALEHETAALKRRDEVAHAEARRQASAGLPVPVALPRGPRGKAGKERDRDDDGGLGFGTLTGAGLVSRLGAGAIGGVGGLIGVGVGLRKAYDEAVSFERAMIEVGKATDTQGAELDAYSERLLKLSRDTGKTKEGLASMLSSAGFAGRPKDELMDFTEYAAKATVAWQTGAEETGQALAELGNIYGANQKRIESIGDAINTMADNSASKETDLLEFLRRSGASGKEAGIAAEQMLAFGSAMKEVGVRNETAGTAMEAFLNVMKLGAKFGKPAGEALEKLGISSDKLRKDFAAKPVETMVGLLEKLNQVADPLKKAEILTGLFGKEYQDDMAKVLNALPQINKYLGIMGDKAQIAKGGVRFQFAQNLDKDVMKIDRANAAINALMTRLGTPLKMLGGDFAERINNAIERLETGDSPIARLLKRFEAQEKIAKPDEAKPSGTAPVYDPIARYTGSVHRTDPDIR